MGLAEAAIASLGTVGSIFGHYQQGKQQAAQANYQAQVAANNATIAEQNARDAVAAGKSEEQRQRIADSQRLGQLRAQQGASGVDLGAGSALDVISGQSMIGEADALASRQKWQSQENGLRQQANSLMNSSSLYSASAQATKSNTIMGTGSSILSNGGRVAKSWYSIF